MNEEDKIFIDNQYKETKMEPSYNKVQYSEFTPDRVGQWVLRGDSIEEVLQMKERLFGMAKPAVVAQPVVSPAPQVGYTAPTTTYTAPTTINQYKELTIDETIAKYGLSDMPAMQLRSPCKKCGGVNVYNPKSGKVFCKAKCWTK